MSKHKWDLLTAMECVQRNKGKIKKSKQITHPGPGIKVLGAIDYLTHYEGFVYMGKPNKR